MGYNILWQILYDITIKGYLVPHEDLLFNVTFHPNVPDNDIRFKVKCKI